MEIKPGTQILYIPSHCDSDENHQDVELGFVTSQRGDTVFCRYWSRWEQDTLRTTANSEGTPIECIVIKDSMPQLIVDEMMEKIKREQYQWS